MPRTYSELYIAVRNRLREDRVAEVQRRIEQVLMQKSRGGGEGDSR